MMYFLFQSVFLNPPDDELKSRILATINERTGR